MPITYVPTENGNGVVHSSFTRPAVYLDHWAVRRLSSDNGLQSRFVNALKRANGTLVFSTWNLAELSNVADPRHAVEFEVFLDAVYPNIYLADFKPDEAIRRETESNNDPALPPPPDLELLQLLGNRVTPPGTALMMKGFLSSFHRLRAVLSASFSETMETLASGINELRQRPEFRTSVKQSKMSAELPMSITCQRELLRGSMLDSAEKFDSHDAADLIHAGYGATYCDFVLLDHKWAHKVKKMQERAAKEGFPIKITQCFSEKNNGLEVFLTALEAVKG